MNMLCAWQFPLVGFNPLSQGKPQRLSVVKNVQANELANGSVL